MNKTQAAFEVVESNLESLLEKLGSPETESVIRDWLKNASIFHKYSYNNQFFLTLQAESRKKPLSNVASFNKWKKLGAHVLKGSKSYSVFFPVKYTLYELDSSGKPKLDASGKKIPQLDIKGDPKQGMSFWVGPVFDVSQTNAKELGLIKTIDLSVSGEIGTDICAEIQAKTTEEFGVTFIDDPNMDAEGSYNYVDHTIKLKPSFEDGANRLSVMFHEIGHMTLHREELQTGNLTYGRMHAERGYREGEAEAFAYALASRFGLETKSELYIAGWGNKVEDIRERMQKISTGLKTFCNSIDIDKYFLELPAVEQSIDM